MSVSLVCSSTYSISDVGYSDGTLSLIVDFSEDLEDRECNLSLSLGSFVRYPSSSLAFLAVSEDVPLLLSRHLDEFATIETISRVLSYIALAIFLLSLGHKMIGAELLFCCQMVCLTNYLYRVPGFLFSSVKQLGLVTGWPLFHTAADRDSVPPFTRHINVGSTFVKNSLVVLCVLLLSMLLWAVLKLVKLGCSDSSAQENRG